MSGFNIIFFGTPAFAVPSLENLVKNGFKVSAVVTSPDRPAGRGLKLKISAVKEFALKQMIPVLQPENLKDESFIAKLKEINPNLQVVVAFRKLPEQVWSLPQCGTINLHASRLPNYRGAAPINWAIINGEKTTGTTTFFINHNIDTGDMIMQNEVEISETDTAGSLHDKLCLSGAELLLKTVKHIKAGNPPRQKQIVTKEIKKAPKLSKKTCLIDWSKQIEDIHNHIKGLSPYPCAFTKLDGKTFKIYQATKEVKAHSRPTGQLKYDKSRIEIAVEGGYIVPEVVQLEGKKKMNVDEFLRGYSIKENSQIG